MLITAASCLITNALCTVFEALSTTCIVIFVSVFEPTALVEPVIAPVEVFKDKPDGKVPEAKLNVIEPPSGSVAPVPVILTEPLPLFEILNTVSAD